MNKDENTLSFLRDSNRLKNILVQYLLNQINKENFPVWWKNILEMR